MLRLSDMAWNLKHLAKYPNITLYPFVIENVWIIYLRIQIFI